MPTRVRLPRALISLRIRNYRLWFTGQVISFAGTWTQTVAQAVLVLRLTDNNGVAAGMSVALQYLPTLLFGVWGGLLADRTDKRRLLMATQVGLAAFAFALALLDAAGMIRLWSLYALVAASGIVNAVDQPARQSFVPELVDEVHLPNAIALNSTIFNSARIVGPAIAGALILGSGTAGCFFVNAASYLASLLALWRMDPLQLRRRAPLVRARGQVRQALSYVRATPVLRSNLLLMTMVGTFAFNFTVVLPLMAKKTFAGGDGTVSTVFMFQGAGAIVGALVLASVERTDGRRLVTATALLGATMALGAAMPSLATFLAVMPLMGAAQLVTASSSNALIQLDTEPSVRGRVTSLRTLTVIGSTPVGGLLAGAVAQSTNPRWALALGAAGCAAGVAVSGSLAADRRARRDHVERPVAAVRRDDAGHATPSTAATEPDAPPRR